MAKAGDQYEMRTGNIWVSMRQNSNTWTSILAGHQSSAFEPACVDEKKRKGRPHTCVPEKSVAEKNTTDREKKTRAEAEQDGGDGGLGKNGTTVDDDDTRRKRPFQVQARSDRHCGNDPREGRAGMARRCDQTLDIFQIGPRSCFGSGTCCGQEKKYKR